MFSKCGRLAVSTVLSLAVVGFFSLSYGSAAEVSREPFQQYISKRCDSDLCKIDFAILPGKTRDEVRNVSCFIKSIEAGFSIEVVQLRVLKPGDVAVSASTLDPQRVGGKQDKVATFAFNHDVFVFASGQEHFQILAQSLLQNFSILACHISGERVRLS